jgi:hypothetical protein
MDTNKKSSFKNIVESYSESARDKIGHEINQFMREKERKGNYPYDGIWRSQKEIVMLQDVMRRKDRSLFVELIVLFVLIAGFDMLFALILFSL